VVAVVAHYTTLILSVREVLFTGGSDDVNFPPAI
jgi:hypothetical protein